MHPRAAMCSIVMGPHFPTKEGSGVVVCPTALDPSSLRGWASLLPCVP
jgi:hypothetical protein